MDRVRMKFSEVQPSRGRLALRIFRRGKLVETWEDENLVVSQGRANTARLLGGATGCHVNRIAVGSNGADPADGDTLANVTDAYIKPILKVTHPQPTQVRFSFALLESEANGLPIRQFGLVCADGTLYAHRTRNGQVIDKDNDMSLEGEWTIFY